MGRHRDPGVVRRIAGQVARRHEARYAADVVGMMMRHQDGDRLEPGVHFAQHDVRVAGIDHDGTAVVVGQGPDVVVFERRQGAQGKHLSR